MLFTYKKQFSKLLQQYFTDLDGSQLLSMIEMVPENIEGDLGFPCFRFAQLFKKSPQQIAEEAVEMIK